MMHQELNYRLTFGRKFAYSVGHVLNDLCASMWFSYLLIFFHKVLQFSNSDAGYILLLGQIADAVCTPLIGFESDRTKGCLGYTKRKSWHLLGTVCVGATFPFLFMVCLGCSGSDAWAQFIYYAPFLVISQFGWAATQISHLSLIPELTPNEGERVELNALRYGFTVISNLTIYLGTWLLLNVNEGSESISSQDAPSFRTLVLVAMSIGALFSFIFHIGTQESPNRQDSFAQQSSHSVNRDIVICHRMAWTDWFQEHQFYQVALLYMCTRLIVNLSQLYLPMYLTDTLGLAKQYIAIVPLVVFLSSFIVSFLMRPINKLIGRKVTFVLGCLLVVGASIWFCLLRGPTLEALAPAILQGAGSATLLITSLSMTADLIGKHTASGAFVYGAMSFTDKLSNGLCVVLIQQMHPCKDGQIYCPASEWYYRNILVFAPGGIAIAAILISATLVSMRLGNLKKFPLTDITETVTNVFTIEGMCTQLEYPEQWVVLSAESSIVSNDRESLVPEDTGRETPTQRQCLIYSTFLDTSWEVEVQAVACTCPRVCECPGNRIANKRLPIDSAGDSTIATPREHSDKYSPEV